MTTFINAYQVLEHLMSNSKNGETSMWGLLKNEMDRLNNENTVLKQENETLQLDQISTLEAIAELYEMMLGGII